MVFNPMLSPWSPKESDTTEQLNTARRDIKAEFFQWGLQQNHLVN